MNNEILLEINVVRKMSYTHGWEWFIPPIYGDLGDGLLLFLPTLLEYQYVYSLNHSRKRSWPI